MVERALTPALIAEALGAPLGEVELSWPPVQAALEARGGGPAALVAAAGAIAAAGGGAFGPAEQPVDAELAARLYDGRADLGNERRGDGHRYRARGYVGLLGRRAYRELGDALGVSLERRPALALRPDVAARALALRIDERGVAALARDGDWEAVWRRLEPCFTGWERFNDAVRRLERALGEAGPAPAPAPRRLVLTSPYMRGEDVRAVQVALGVAADGLYGPVTAGAAVEWKRRSGYPERELAPELEPADVERLLGRAPLPPAYVRRARARAGLAAGGGGEGVPALAVAEMEAWARAGISERPPGSNRVPELARLASKLGVAAELRDLGYPWCALAAFLAALSAGGASARAGLVERAFNGLYCPAILAAATGAAHGLRVVAGAHAARGDLVLFDWSPHGDPADHVGRLVRPPVDGTVETVDGNTLGGRVALRTRPASAVRAYVRDS